MAINIFQKKMSIPTLINLILVVSLLVVVTFGYFFYLKQNPVELTTKMIVPPAPVAPYKFVYNLTGKGDFVLRNPEGVAYGNKRIWVADTANQRVVVFDLNGEPLFSFGNAKNDKIKLNAPVGVLVDNDRVFVVDYRLRNIVEYTLDGTLVGYFGEKMVPMPVAFKRYQDKYVALDFAGPGLIFLDQTGKIVAKIHAGKGDKEGNLNLPQELTVMGNRIYVADSLNNRLQYTDNDKGPLKLVKIKDAELGYPYSIEATKDRLFVGSALGRAVRVFEPGAELKNINIVDVADNDGINMGVPGGIAVDDLGKVYVNDISHSRIMVYGQ